jgi:hypothetical protein
MKFRIPTLLVVVLSALLVAAPLAANLCHHHDSSSDNNCPVCHFNHQAMDRPIAAQPLPSFGIVTFHPAPAASPFVASLALSPLPSRAPPAA